MANEGNLYSWAAHTIRNGLSSAQGLRELRSAGLSIANQTWYGLVAEVKVDFAKRATIAEADLNRRPRAAEILAMRAPGGSGYLQQVDIWVKHRESGQIYARPFSLATDYLTTHADAIATGIEKFSQYAGNYGEQILGGAYAATYLLTDEVI